MYLQSVFFFNVPLLKIHMWMGMSMLSNTPSLFSDGGGEVFLILGNLLRKIKGHMTQKKLS